LSSDGDRSSVAIAKEGCSIGGRYVVVTVNELQNPHELVFSTFDLDASTRHSVNVPFSRLFGVVRQEHPHLLTPGRRRHLIQALLRRLRFFDDDTVRGGGGGDLVVGVVVDGGGEIDERTGQARDTGAGVVGTLCFDLNIGGGGGDNDDSSLSQWRAQSAAASAATTSSPSSANIGHNDNNNNDNDDDDEFDGVVTVNQMEIGVECRHLPSNARFGKADPLVAMYVRDDAARTFAYVGQTERHVDERNPSFARKFLVEHYSNDDQTVKFCVFDADNGERVRRGDMLGSVSVSLRSFAEAAATSTSPSVSRSGQGNGNGNDEDAQCTRIVVRHLKDDDGAPVIGDDGQEATIAFYHRSIVMSECTPDDDAGGDADGGGGDADGGGGGGGGKLTIVLRGINLPQLAHDDGGGGGGGGGGGEDTAPQPLVALFVNDPTADGAYMYAGQTERRDDTLAFERQFVIDYYADSSEKLRFCVYGAAGDDDDFSGAAQGGSGGLGCDRRLLGRADVSLRTLVARLAPDADADGDGGDGGTVRFTLMDRNGLLMEGVTLELTALSRSSAAAAADADKQRRRAARADADKERRADAAAEERRLVQQRANKMAAEKAAEKAERRRRADDAEKAVEAVAAEAAAAVAQQQQQADTDAACAVTAALAAANDNDGDGGGGGGDDSDTFNDEEAFTCVASASFRISCRSLPRGGGRAPLVAVYVRDDAGLFQCRGQTEAAASGGRDPTFTNPVALDNCLFVVGNDAIGKAISVVRRSQGGDELKFCVFDVDDNGEINMDDLLGSAVMRLSDVARRMRAERTATVTETKLLNDKSKTDNDDGGDGDDDGATIDIQCSIARLSDVLGNGGDDDNDGDVSVLSGLARSDRATEAASPASASFLATPLHSSVHGGRCVTLRIACAALKKNDVFGKSDPVCAVYVTGNDNDGDGDVYALAGQTETVMNNHDPSFDTAVGVTVPAGGAVKLCVYDVDGDDALDEKDLLGTLSVNDADLHGIIDGAALLDGEGKQANGGKSTISVTITVDGGDNGNDTVDDADVNGDDTYENDKCDDDTATDDEMEAAARRAEEREDELELLAMQQELEDEEAAQREKLMDEEADIIMAAADAADAAAAVEDDALAAERLEEEREEQAELLAMQQELAADEAAAAQKTTASAATTVDDAASAPQSAAAPSTSTEPETEAPQETPPVAEAVATSSSVASAASASSSSHALMFSISCRDLPRTERDMLSAADPLCVVYTRKTDSDVDDAYLFAGKTEALSNEKNPDFVDTVLIDVTSPTAALTDAPVELKFAVFDVDDADKIGVDDLIGGAVVSAAQLAAASNGGRRLSLPLLDKDDKPCGDAVITIQFTVAAAALSASASVPSVDRASVASFSAASSVNEYDNNDFEADDETNDEDGVAAVPVSVGVSDPATAATPTVADTAATADDEAAVVDTVVVVAAAAVASDDASTAESGDAVAAATATEEPVAAAAVSAAAAAPVFVTVSCMNLQTLNNSDTATCLLAMYAVDHASDRYAHVDQSEPCSSAVAPHSFAFSETFEVPAALGANADLKLCLFDVAGSRESFTDKICGSVSVDVVTLLSSGDGGASFPLRDNAGAPLQHGSLWIAASADKDALTARAAAARSITVNTSVECRSLPLRADGGAPDVVCVCYASDEAAGGFISIGQTECRSGVTSAVFETVLRMSLVSNTELKLCVYDACGGDDVKLEDMIGVASTVVTNAVSGRTISLPMSDTRNAAPLANGDGGAPTLLLSFADFAGAAAVDTTTTDGGSRAGASVASAVAAPTGDKDSVAGPRSLMRRASLIASRIAAAGSDGLVRFEINVSGRNFVRLKNQFGRPRTPREQDKKMITSDAVISVHLSNPNSKELVHVAQTELEPNDGFPVFDQPISFTHKLYDDAADTSKLNDASLVFSVFDTDEGELAEDERAGSVTVSLLDLIDQRPDEEHVYSLSNPLNKMYNTALERNKAVLVLSASLSPVNDNEPGMATDANESI
jgi:hypothetical protein